MPAESLKSVKARVLFLGEDSAFGLSIIESLRLESYEVLVASNCSQAIDTFRDGDVDALVIDLDIPSKDLGQLVANLTAREPRGRTLVMARSLEQLILASEAGADVVLIRSLNWNRIGRVVRSLLAGGRTQTLNERWLNDEAVPFFLSTERLV